MLQIEGSAITTELGKIYSLGAISNLEAAERIAIGRGDRAVTTTHLLGALVSDDNQDRLDLLESCGGERDLEMVRLRHLIHFMPPIRTPRLDFAPELYRTVKTAASEAVQYELDYLEGNHLLRAIALNTDCEANAILAKLGVDRKCLAEVCAPGGLKVRWGYTYSLKQHAFVKPDSPLQ